MGLITAILVLVGIAILAVLAKALHQNLGLLRQVRSGERPIAALLRDALVLWSPLALVILVLAFAANRLAATAISATYRWTTLDEFCEVPELPGGLVLPCTELGGELRRDLVRPAGVEADLERHLSGRYRIARRGLLARSDAELATLAGNRPALVRAVSPQGVLGLEPAPEDDSELFRLKHELRALLRTPTRPARDMLDLVRFISERDARLRRMRELTALVQARRKQVNDEAYWGLPRAEQGRLYLSHRISSLLGSGSLTRPGAQHTRGGLLTALARDEARALQALRSEGRTDTGSASLYLALGMQRRCTIATEDPGLRTRATASGDGAVRASNAGTFPCEVFKDAPATLQLRSLGFRESVRRSIDRWHDELARGAFRRMGGISRRVALSDEDARALDRELASVVPEGIDLGREDCGLLHPANCAANAMRATVEDGYVQARAGAMESYRQQATAAGKGIDQRVGDSLLVLDSQLDEMRSTAHAYAQRLFTVGTLMRLLGWLAVVLVAIKSFLYVLALELFHSEEKLAIAFEGAPAIEGEYRTARRLTIDRDFPWAMITRKQLSNTDNNVRLAPWPWSSPLARIFRGRYFVFTRGSFLADGDGPATRGQAPLGMVASAGSGQSIVEWKMKPGEEVVFRYKDFYGASENVELLSEISFRLSTLLLGRVVFHFARCSNGEGRLLLKADVEEIAQEDIRALPPERMIAWNRHAQFTVHSGRTPWKTLLNGFTLVRRSRADGSNGKIVVSSDDASSNLGSIRFLKRIFSAIF